MVITLNSNNFWVISRISQSFPVVFPMLPLEMKLLNDLLNYTPLVSSVSNIFTFSLTIDDHFDDKMVTKFSDVVGTDQNKHRNPATTWWNTYLVNYHFGQLFYALETYGDPDAFYAKLGWTKGAGHFVLMSFPSYFR